MVKTQDPTELKIGPGHRVSTDAIPDAFDERDLPYIPRLDPLKPALDQRLGAYVMRQEGS